jgi:hypothetical protein
MTSQPWITLTVSALTNFIISAGGCLTTAMVATGSATMPTAAVMIFATVTGLIAAARGLQAILSAPPGPAPRAASDDGGRAR